MRHMKKTLAWLLMACMVLSLAPAAVFASETGSGEDIIVADDGLNEGESEEQETELDITVTPTPTAGAEEEGQEGDAAADPAADTEPAAEQPAAMTAAPGTAAASTTASVTLDTSKFYKIYHLDCGRKYFSVDQIKNVIDILAANDFNTLELAVGNDGMRFLLDDMSVTVDGTTYSSDAVKAGIQAGNKAYYDAGTNELTEAEMDEIFAYASGKNISIIPLINTPGHMDAILTAANTVTGTTCSYNGSSRTIDVTNTTAVNFTLAFVEKYIQYFAGKGCTIFNMGCDEYANDIYTGGSMGFGNLVSSGNYGSFITYVNTLAQQVQAAGMSPMAFNDGFYFNGNTSSGTFDTNIVISFWSSGWSGYTSMSASDLAAKGHKIINTNGDWYYILKTSNIDSVKTNITNAPYNYVMGSGTMDVAGSMVCFWCDTPSYDYDETEVANLTSQVSTFASVNSSVFNQPQLVTKKDEATRISVTAYDLTGLTITAAEAPVIENAIRTIAYDVTPQIATGNYTGSGQVSIPIPEGWNTGNINAFVVNSDGTVEKITDVAISDGIATYTAPHFSVTGLSEDEKVITVMAGKTATVEILGVNLSGNTYTTEDPSVATVEVTGSDGGEGTVEYVQASVTCNDLISSDSGSWVAASGYYYSPDGTNYYPIYAKRTNVYGLYYRYYWGYSATDSASNVTALNSNGQNTTDSSSTPSITVYEMTGGEGTPASTTITFTAAADAVGQSTTVTINGVIYRINVIAEDVSEVNPLSIEYWITNGRPTDADGNKAYSIAPGDAYGEEGVEVTAILPVNTTKESRTIQYWRSRLLDTTLTNGSTNGTEEQTETAGDDDTYSGTEFTKVRYVNGTWAVYTVNNEWVNVTSDHQLVAYYLEILPIADELTVLAADWGKKGDGSTSGDYLDPSSSCTVSVQIVYEDGTTNPATTTAADLKSATIAYGYWTSGRGVGTLYFTGLEGYQIWKIEAETGSHTHASSSSMWGTYTVDSFTWDNNPLTVYEGEPVDSYAIHNDAHDFSTEGAYANLMWDENYESILIKVYAKAKPAEENLKVVYYDEEFGEELYNYEINVNDGVTFDAITPTPSAFAGNADRIDVTGCGIENVLGVTQKFQTDLSKVPEAVGKYNSGLYIYTGSEISADKKTLYLYYNINTDVLFPKYVVDYGRTFTFGLDAIVTDPGLVTGVSVGENTRYGTLAYDDGTRTFTYTPTQVLPATDVLTINLTFNDGSTKTMKSGVIPATTIDYEEGFAALSGFIGGSMGTTLQTTQVAGKSTDEYGYDAAVAGESNTSAAASAKGSTAAFGFTGTGVDLYVNSTGDSGNIAVQVRNADTNRLVKVISVQTTSNSTITGNFSDTEQKGLIAASVQGLAYGSYTVKITTTSDAAVYFDGFRVYGTLEDMANTEYTNDMEDNPVFLELRDYVLTALDVNNTTSSADAYAQIRNTTDGQLTGVVLNQNGGSYNGQELLENGPKNELFLLPGESVVFKLTTNREVQIGMKAVNGSAAVTGSYAGTIGTERDMFYTVAANEATASEKTITITNNSTGTILSITKVKICDDPNAAFAELSEEDLAEALAVLGGAETEEPGEPEVVYADAVLNLAVNDADGNALGTTTLTASGVAGESAVFTAEEIQKAVTALVPEGYKLEEASYSDVTVVYGESSDVAFKAVKEAAAEPEPSQPKTIFGKIIDTFKDILGRITMVNKSAGTTLSAVTVKVYNGPAAAAAEPLEEPVEPDQPQTIISKIVSNIRNFIWQAY